MCPVPSAMVCGWRERRTERAIDPFNFQPEATRSTSFWLLALRWICHEYIEPLQDHRITLQGYLNEAFISYSWRFYRKIRKSDTVKSFFFSKLGLKLKIVYDANDACFNQIFSLFWGAFWELFKHVDAGIQWCLVTGYWKSFLHYWVRIWGFRVWRHFAFELKVFFKIIVNFICFVIKTWET